jgi:hypothetical protein
MKMNRTRGAFGALLCLAPVLFAGQTRTWTQGDFSDYDKAILKNLSLRSDGRLSLAPKSREVYDTGSAYLWALAQDSKGNLYTGGGTNAKLYRIPPDGKGKLLAELDGLEVHAIAIDSRDRVYAATAPDGKVYRINAAGKPEVFYDPKAKYIWSLPAIRGRSTASHPTARAKSSSAPKRLTCAPWCSTPRVTSSWAPSPGAWCCAFRRPAKGSCSTNYRSGK